MRRGYRKEMKRGYSKKVYHQRSKDETFFSVVKMTIGDEVRSVRTKAQNNEIGFRVIAYNAMRIASLASSFLRGFLQSPLLVLCHTTLEGSGPVGPALEQVLRVDSGFG